MFELYNDGHFEHGLNISNSFPVIFNLKKTEHVNTKEKYCFFLYFTC